MPVNTNPIVFLGTRALRVGAGNYMNVVATSRERAGVKPRVRADAPEPGFRRVFM
jgi:hypothetical protein